jgi:tRNA G10  N-methylase Trm11
MQTFLLLFGNTSQLSELEFQAQYPQLPLRRLAEQLYSFQSETDLSAEMMQALGGVVKIFVTRQELDNTVSVEAVIEAITALLLASAQEPYFTISQIGKGQRSINNAAVKALIKENGRQARYFASELHDSALLSHQSKATEILLFNDQERGVVSINQLTAVQDIDDWTKRDREKPYADRKKGMLPPKVARMMVNSAAGIWKQAHPDQSPLLYDPFCGTGTVLAEAAVRGLAVCGSDIDEKAVFGARENLTWLASEYGLQLESAVFYMDAAHIEIAKFPRQVDVLVTEPFLGKQTPRDAELANVFRGLEKMYLGSFKAWSQILADGAIVAIVFPQVTTDRHIYTLDSLIDKLRAKGYNSLVNPILYAREGARVARNIYIFRFQRG